MADETPQETPQGDPQQDASNGASDNNAPEPQEAGAFSATELGATLKRLGITIKSQSKDEAEATAKSEAFVKGRAWVRERLFGSTGYLTRGLEKHALEGEDATRYKMLFHAAVLREPLTPLLSSTLTAITEVDTYQNILSRTQAFTGKVTKEDLDAAAGKMIEAVYLTSYVVMEAMDEGKGGQAFELCWNVSQMVIDDIFKSLKELAAAYERGRQEVVGQARREDQERQQAPNVPTGYLTRGETAADESFLGFVEKFDQHCRTAKMLIEKALSIPLDQKRDGMPFTGQGYDLAEQGDLFRTLTPFYYFKPVHVRTYDLLQDLLNYQDVRRTAQEAHELLRQARQEDHLHPSGKAEELLRSLLRSNLELMGLWRRMLNTVPDERLLRAYFFTQEADGHTLLRHAFKFDGKLYVCPSLCPEDLGAGAVAKVSAMISGTDAYEIVVDLTKILQELIASHEAAHDEASLLLEHARTAPEGEVL